MLPIFHLVNSNISEYGSIEISMNGEKHPLYILSEYYFKWLFGYADLEDQEYLEGFRNALYACGYDRNKKASSEPEEATLPASVVTLYKPLAGWSEALALKKKEPPVVELSKGCGEMALQLAYEGKFDFLFTEATAFNSQRL